MPLLRVLALSGLFPNPQQPRHGIFLKHRLTHLARHGPAEIQMVAPVPYFPSGHPVFRSYAAYARVPRTEPAAPIPVSHPRILCIPKIGMHLAPLLMAACLVQHLRDIRRTGFDFDVIDAYYLYPDGVAAALLGLLFQRPVVLTAFGSDVSQIPDWRLPRAAILWALRRAGQTTAVCEALLDRLVELGADSEHMKVVMHGVDLDLFCPVRDRAALRTRLGFVGPTVVSAGHLIPRKGHDVAIRAMALRPDCQLHIVGDGPEEGRLRQLVDGLGLNGQVRFHGHVSQPLLADLLAGADLLLNCSDREGIANVLLEAQACGTPVAATPIWGSPEVVSVPEAGLLLRDRTPEAAAEGIGQLLAAPPDRAETRRHAERFSWQATAHQHMATLQHAVRASLQTQQQGQPRNARARKN